MSSHSWSRTGRHLPLLPDALRSPGTPQYVSTVQLLCHIHCYLRVHCILQECYWLYRRSCLSFYKASKNPSRCDHFFPTVTESANEGGGCILQCGGDRGKWRANTAPPILWPHHHWPHPHPAPCGCPWWVAITPCRLLYVFPHPPPPLTPHNVPPLQVKR